MAKGTSHPDVRSLAVKADDVPEVLPWQPPGSNAVLEEYPGGGVIVTLPPGGLWRGSRGLFAFGLGWCGLLAIATGAVAVLGIPTGGLWAVLLFGLAFWLGGVVALLAGIHMGRRSAVLAVVGDTLLVLQTGLTGTRRREWRSEQVADICTATSNYEINDVPLLELQIVTRKGNKVRMLVGRPDDELRWLAALLRLALLGPLSGGPPTPPDTARRP
jgi:hypothetical protein